MKLKFCFLFLLLAILLIQAELKPKKDKKSKSRPRHRDRGRGHHLKKKMRFKDIVEDIFFQIFDGPTPDEDEEDDDINEWLYDIQEPEGLCSPNPCLHNGVCRTRGKKRFKCDCLKPFRGKRCDRGPKRCKKRMCGRGECVVTSTPPFYECKCKPPFQPPDCKTYSVCDPSPCHNGGVCVINGNDFDCMCPPGYRGQFCDIGPDDCFVDDGASYRGNVSETEDGDECLQWNSHFILNYGVDPFTSYEDPSGLGHHNLCRNPDGETMPWCFYRRGGTVSWDYCDVTECPDQGVVPADVEPNTDSEESEPTIATPPVTERPSEAPPTPARPTAPLVPGPTAPAPEFSTCGKPQPRKRITRIFGGLKVSPGAIPWQVSLQVRPQNTDRPFKHICGGVLIKSCWVLTASHCIETGRKQDMQVLMGSLSLDFPDPDAQILRVEEAFVHENFRESSTSVHNDIALLRLRGSNGVCARETQFVKAACLPDAPLPDGIDCTISGWGVNETGSAPTISNHMLEANVLLINQDKCSEPAIYGTKLDNSMVCAGHLQGGVDSCQGDSGGPLTCKQSDYHVVYGLVSWGDQCGMKNKPGVYARVTNFLEWINSKIQAATA